MASLWCLSQSSLRNFASDIIRNCFLYLSLVDSSKQSIEFDSRESDFSFELKCDEVHNLGMRLPV